VAVQSLAAGEERAALRVRWSELDHEAWLSILDAHGGIVLSAVSRTLPGRLAEVGVGKDRFREIAEKSMHDRAVLNNPRPIKGPAEVMEILDLAA